MALKILRYLRMCEVIHFVNHIHGTLYDRVGAESTRTFAKSHIEMQKWLGVHGIKHELMPALVAAMAENSIIHYVLVEL